MGRFADLLASLFPPRRYYFLECRSCRRSMVVTLRPGAGEFCDCSNPPAQMAMRPAHHDDEPNGFDERNWLIPPF